MADSGTRVSKVLQNYMVFILSGTVVCMQRLRKIFWLSVLHNFSIDSVYIASADNVLCDSLSRLNEEDAMSKVREVTSQESLCCFNIFSTISR